MWYKPWIDEIKNYWTDQSIVSTCVFCDHAVIVLLLLLGDTTSVGIRLNRYWCHSISNGCCQLEGTTNGEQCIFLSVCWLHSINRAFICIVNVMYCVLSYSCCLSICLSVCLSVCLIVDSVVLSQSVTSCGQCSVLYCTIDMVIFKGYHIVGKVMQIRWNWILCIIYIPWQLHVDNNCGVIQLCVWWCREVMMLLFSQEGKEHLKDGGCSSSWIRWRSLGLGVCLRREQPVLSWKQSSTYPLMHLWTHHI